MKSIVIDIYALLAKLVGILLVVTLPIRHSIIAAAVLILADFVSGVWASIKAKKPITSTGFRRTLNKLFAYESAILIAFILEQYMLDGLPIVKVITGLVGVTEGKSFFENLSRITGINFWSQIISKLNMDDLKNPKNDKE